jgi:hypothetical protein
MTVTTLNKCAEVAAALIAEHNIVLRDPEADEPEPSTVCVAAVEAMSPEDVMAIIWSCEAGAHDWFVSSVAVSGPDEDLHTILRYVAMTALDETIQKQLLATK